MPKAFLIRREDRIRTCDPLVPNQVRYRPALLPETATSFLMGSKGNELNFISQIRAFFLNKHLLVSRHLFHHPLSFRA